MTATPTLSRRQRETLALLLTYDGREVYLSNALDEEARTIPTRTADVLEAAGLIECEDIGKVSSAWIAHLTDEGRHVAMKQIGAIA